MANALAVVHLAYIAFAVFGGLLVLRWSRVAWLHIPAVVWSALVELANWPCPLTRWENLALHRAGEPGYRGDFIAHVLFRAIYPSGLTRQMEFALAAFVVIVNVTVYALVIARSARRRAPHAAGPA